MSGVVAVVLACVAVSPDAEAPPGGGWHFVLPPAGDPFEHPPFRALGLTREKPDGVAEKVAYSGRGRRYAQLRFGSPGSVRVSVVLDDLAPGRADLYVDADRNRRIEPRDRVTPAGDGRTWRVPLDVEVVDGEITRSERRGYVFRLGATGLTFRAAAAGYLDGSVVIGGRRRAARRTDGDGNGRLTDPRDRVWVDLDDDGRWDPAGEQFSYAPVLTLAGGRYAAWSDEYGRRLALGPLEGTGTVRLALGRPGASIADLSVTLVGRDGSAVGLAGGGASAEVPVGEYRLGTVVLALDDPAGGPRWWYVFSDHGRRGEPVWYSVGKGVAVAIDPLEAVALEAGLEGPGPRSPGDDLVVRPGLFTGDGLRIVTCYRGTPTTPGGDDGPAAEITLSDRAGRALVRARSGFA